MNNNSNEINYRDNTNFISGYKVFQYNLINRYGFQFNENTIYKIDTSNRKIRFGNNGYGFHFVKRLEDGLRYFDGMNEKISIAVVQSLGNVTTFYDDYYGYYDLYVTDKILIKQALTREEIIDYILNTNEQRVMRFVQGFKLEDEEIERLLNKFNSDFLRNIVDYYQKGKKDVFEKEYIKK